MAESIVVVPYDTSIGLDASKDDYDFIGFSFNGIFSINNQFKIYRVSDGSRYTNKLGASNTEKTAENTGGDGTYYFGTLNRSKSFQINFVFDDLTDSGLRALKDWLCTDQLTDLWFYEEPYKVYTAKPVGEPNIKFIAFDAVDDQNRPIRLYKGEGSVEFVAYWPYAHTPDYVKKKDGVYQSYSGKMISSYNEFKNCEQWKGSSNIGANYDLGDNRGQLPAYFQVVSGSSQTIPGNSYFKIGDIEITLQLASTVDIRDFIWDSKTGIISGFTTQGQTERELIPYEGNPCGTIPVVGSSPVTVIKPAITELNYYYWYR